MAVYKRGSTWWIRFQSHGVEIRESARTSSKVAAKAWERTRRAELGAGWRRTKPRTYGEALVRYVESGAPESMTDHANHTRAHLQHLALSDVPEGAQQMRADWLAAGLSPLTVNRRLAVVRRVLNLAFKEWGWLDTPIGQKVALMPTKGSERHTYLSREEVASLVAAFTNRTAAAVSLLAAYTGLRRGELLRLKPEHWQAPYIVLSAATKGKKPRTVPLIPDLHHLMAPLPFGISKDSLRWHFDRAREAIGRPDVRFHDLRHTFASWLASDPTVPLTVIRDVLGHSSLAMTGRYAHLRTDALLAVTRSLEKKPA